MALIDDMRAERAELLGARIKYLREQKGMTVTAFAKAIGVSRSVINTLESGDKTPGVWVVVAAARVLETTPNRLLISPAKEKILK